ncbi:hypothetical protein TSUD_280520 [Trifolium subterraneum]|uniref:MULE transposase domain-containing protein n=1 Tax=Trifolium subterraneum TaxID=3900 RepID=A0A2Z6NP99_TRISU|nr:hypothetical protein TSUD_280520 [Trifolium subterraneum]
MTDHEMVDMHEHTTMISSNEIHESAIDADPLNDRIPSELPLEPFEGMEFTSIEDVKNYYVSYARNKGFSFRMGRVTKSRTNGPSKIAAVLCTENGGVDNGGVSQQDVINYLSVKRQKQMENGDAQLMLSYFKNCQLKNPGFFYAFQMDADGKLANCFWVDSRSRMAYKYFGDVVTFDPTYLTNKYKMPFVPFTGVNHHQQSILFGCALLWDETEESFVWLLSTWLEAMDEVSPKTIITDQDAAISNAVAKVFPQVNHHYCMWHIEKKVPQYLNHIYHEYKLDLLDVEESAEEFVTSKGCPRTLRMKGSLELLKKGSYNCGYCKEKGHNKLKCPSLKHRRCDIINGQLSNSKAKASGIWKYINNFEQDHKIHYAGDVSS